jgi:hypothetical protein
MRLRQVSVTVENNFARAEAEFHRIVDERAGLCTHTYRSNCIGSAIFVVGEQARDAFINTESVPQLRSMERTKNPTEGCLVAWERDVGSERHTHHLALIASIDEYGEFKVTERNGAGGDFRVNKTSVFSNYAHDEMVYYLPTGLKLAREQGIVFNPQLAPEAKEDKVDRTLKGIIRDVFSQEPFHR